MAVDDPEDTVEMETAEPGADSLTKAAPDRPAGTSARKTIFAIASATVIVKTALAKKHFTPNREKRESCEQLLALDPCQVELRRGRLG
jgi:hypothetical protein